MRETDNHIDQLIAAKDADNQIAGLSSWRIVRTWYWWKLSGQGIQGPGPKPLDLLKATLYHQLGRRWLRIKRALGR